MDFARPLFIFQDYILCNSFDSEVDFKSGSFSTRDSALRSSFLALGCSGLSVGLPFSSLCTLCTTFLVLVLEGALSEVSCCCCCCDCQALVSTIFVAGRGVESLSNKVQFPFLRNCFVSAICQHRLITAFVLVCQNRSPSSCAWAKLTQQTAS